MSMISRQVKRLRDEAEFCSEIGNLPYEKILNEAADTIEELSAKIHAANMELSTAYYHGGWIPLDERLPDPDEHVLLSFENCSEPIIGRYTVDDDDGGTFRIGDEDKSFIEYDLFVNAWMPLPESMRDET